MRDPDTDASLDTGSEYAATLGRGVVDITCHQGQAGTNRADPEAKLAAKTQALLQVRG